MSVQIRQATKRDGVLIASLSQKTFYDSFAPQNSQENMEKFMREQFSNEALIKEVDDPGNIFFLAHTGHEVVGYAKMREGEKRVEFGTSTSIEIARIYALKSSIGKGIGSALMQKCLDTASELKRNIIWLGVWEHNKLAIDFYTRWGFEKFGDHDFVLGDDVQRDWLMKKII